MNRWLIALLALIAVSAQAGDWRETVTPPAVGKFPPPRPFKAIYRFGWSGLTAAEANFDLTRVPRSQFRLVMTTKTIGAVRALWRMDSQHDALCTAATLRPISLQQTEVYKDETETVKVQFSPEGVVRQTKVIPTTEPPQRERKFKCANVLDLQTALFFLRSQRLQTGDQYRLVVYPEKAPYLTDVEVIGREKIKVGAGTFDAIKCQVRIQGIGKKYELEPHKKFKRAYAWLADDRDRMLLKIDAQIFVGSVWAELQSVEFPGP